MVGIIDYGFYFPQYRIKVEEIAKQWKKDPNQVKSSLKLQEKAVAGIDEDMVTMGHAAAQMAISSESIEKDIRAVFVGSETFPYSVKPTSTIIPSWLGMDEQYLAFDSQFACKAATGAFISALGLVKAKEVTSALVIASDKSNARPGDALEYTAGSGANAWILGSKEVIAEVIDWSSFSSDTPDFWRRAKADYPSHLGRFSGTPAYYKHIIASSKQLLNKQSLSPEAFDYAVFHMPNGSFPRRVAQALGFDQKQLKPSLVVEQLGNSYSASALMGLVAVLEKAKPGNMIFFASYGSGSGSDAMILKVTNQIEKKRKPFTKVLKSKLYLDYSEYLKYMGVL